jgi:hypothetical protein
MGLLERPSAQQNFLYAVLVDAVNEIGGEQIDEARCRNAYNVFRRIFNSDYSTTYWLNRLDNSTRSGTVDRRKFGAVVAPVRLNDVFVYVTLFYHKSSTKRGQIDVRGMAGFLWQNDAIPYIPFETLMEVVDRSRGEQAFEGSEEALRFRRSYVTPSTSFVHYSCYENIMSVSEISEGITKLLKSLAIAKQKTMEHTLERLQQLSDQLVRQTDLYQKALVDYELTKNTLEMFIGQIPERAENE